MDSAVYFLAWQLKNLPVYTLAAKVCPPGVEASLTACIAGMNDLSGSVAQYFGAWLTTMCGVTSTDFKQVWVLYLVRTACKLIPIPLVLLVPSEARLEEALRDVRRTFAKMERKDQEREASRRARLQRSLSQESLSVARSNSGGSLGSNAAPDGSANGTPRTPPPRLKGKDLLDQRARATAKGGTGKDVLGVATSHRVQ